MRAWRAGWIAEDLRNAITDGEFGPDGRLPSVSDLANRYGVSRSTVTRALDTLRVDGLTEHRHGAGVFVRPFARIVRRSPQRLSAGQWGSGTPIQDHDTVGRARTVRVEVRREPAQADIARALRVDAGAPVVTRARRFDVDGRTVQLATSWLPVDVATGTAIEDVDTGAGGIYARLAETGQAPTHFEERIISRRPSADEAAALRLPLTGVSVVELTRYAYTAEGRCVEVNRMVLDAAVYELRYWLTA